MTTVRTVAMKAERRDGEDRPPSFSLSPSSPAGKGSWTQLQKPILQVQRKEKWRIDGEVSDTNLPDLLYSFLTAYLKMYPHAFTKLS